MYRKEYTRELSLITIELWQKQFVYVKKSLGFEFPPILCDVQGGIAEVYFSKNLLRAWIGSYKKIVLQKPNIITKALSRFEHDLAKQATFWDQKNIITNQQDLSKFGKLSAKTWAGLLVSYYLPQTPGAPKKEKSKAMRLREQSIDFLVKTDFVITNTVQRLYPLSKAYAKYISLHEAVSGKIPTLFELKQRHKQYIFVANKIYTNTSLSDLSIHTDLQQISKKTDQTKVLYGHTAMKGKIIGLVRIIKQKNQAAKLNRGEVLVSTMTTSDLLPAMRKASAFITDEGGITCHAAIVARELRKPCVIGTKVATQVLKNGDKVEVDADHGIVKLLGRNPNP